MTQTIQNSEKDRWNDHRVESERHLTETGDFQLAKRHWQIAWILSGGNADLEVLGEALIKTAHLQAERD